MWWRWMPVRWTHNVHEGRRVRGVRAEEEERGVSKQGLVGGAPCLSWKKRPVRRWRGAGEWSRGALLWVPDSGRRTPVSPSCTSCSTLRPRRLAREERPRCCCMRQPGVQDTGDRKKKKIRQNECEGEADMPPRLGSMWTSLACPVRCCWMP